MATDNQQATWVYKLSVSTTGKVWAFYIYFIIDNLLKVQSIPMLKHAIHIFKKYRLVIR